MGLFIFDCLSVDERDTLHNAFKEFNDVVMRMGGEIKMSGVLDYKKPLVVL
jgi:hypothetical protein